MALRKSALVLGGNGNLGKAIVSCYAQTFNVTSIDLSANNVATNNFEFNPQNSVTDQVKSITYTLAKNSIKFDSIICAAGGFDMCRVKDDIIFEQYTKLNSMNVTSSLIAAHLATKFLNENGLLIFTGAAGPFKNPSPEMVAYALAKNAVHSLSINMAELLEIPQSSTVITILPETIDTPQNREAMATADFSKWAKPEQIGGLLKMWSEGNNKPKNGSFVILKVDNNSVYPEFIQPNRN